MAPVIRMKRGGRTHAPYYRVVVMDSRRRGRGREIEQIGFYHPCAQPEPLSEIDTVKALSWLKKGARLSDTARNIFTKKGILAVFSGNAALEEILAPPGPDEAATGLAEAESTLEPSATPADTAEAEPEPEPEKEASAAPEAAPAETAKTAPEAEPPADGAMAD